MDQYFKAKLLCNIVKYTMSFRENLLKPLCIHIWLSAVKLRKIAYLFMQSLEAKVVLLKRELKRSSLLRSCYFLLRG